MKVTLLYIGKTGKSFLEEGEKEYTKRVQRYINFVIEEIPDIKNIKKRSEQEIKNLEGKQFLKRLKSNDFVVLLDEKGKTFTSLYFSAYLQNKFNSINQRFVFVIGGPYGFSEAVKKRSNQSISLSKMTFSHQMIRMIFIEQLYRGLSILNNEPYHHQ